MTTPRTRWWWALLGVVLIGIAGSAAWNLWQRRSQRGQPSPAQLRAALRQAWQAGPPEVAVYGEVPAFHLVDQTGRPFTRDDMLGRLWIADFIFTRCAGQCLLMTSRMAALQERLPAAAHFVSISVDPSWDTPERLAGYAVRAGAQESRWHFVTGSQDEIFRLSREGFRLAVEPEGGPEAEPIIHSVRFVLVDQQGRIRGYYDATEEAAVDRLLLDVQTLLTRPDA